MNDQEIAAAIAEHGKWISRFVINGTSYGGLFDPFKDPRLDAFFTAFPAVATILELGSLEGGHTIALAQRPRVTRVVGLEGREANLRRARLMARLLNAGKVEFIRADLETVALREFGSFDAIFCAGLLYHLPEPWKLLRQFTQVSPRAFFSTHYCKESEADTTCEGYKGKMQIEGGLEEPRSGLSPHSFWPTLGSLIQMLTEAGFQVLHILENAITESAGPVVTIAAFATRQEAAASNDQRAH